MIDDFKPTPKPKPSEEQAPLNIFDTPRESIESAAVRRPLVDEDKIEQLLGQPPDNVIRDETNTDEPRRGAAWTRRLRSWWRGLSKKKRILLIVVSLLVIAIASGSAAYFVVHGKKPKANALTTSKVTKKAPVDTRVPSTLSGVLVDPAVNQRPVTGVMIENSTDARPQSGLGDASVVFEAIAEGGITRFLALFQDTQPDFIGPVRSVRPYYEQWALGFDAAIAHVGGSPEALTNIKDWGVKDLDQFYNSGAYNRISTRYAPHNVYTSIAKLNEVESSKGYSSSSFTGFARKKEQPYKAPAASTSKTKTTTKADTRTAVNTIDVAISSALYNNHYDYDATTNSYNRSEGGQPHMVVDAANAQKQITPKVIITLIMPYGIQSDGKHSEYGTIGTGNMLVFQDGTVTAGTWTKTANNTQFQFSDSEGHSLPLNPGQTWITTVDAATDVSYK